MASRPELRVDAHVLVQLGSELVTDAEQAILECVKNAYDADSPGCRIVIDTNERGVQVETGTAGDLAKFLRPFETVEPSLRRADGTRLDPRTARPSDTVQRHLHYRGRISIEDAGDGLTEEQLRDSWLVISQSAKRVGEGGPKKKTRRGRTPLGDKGLGRLGSMKLGDILLIETATARNAPINTAQFRWTDCETAKTVDEIPVYARRTANKDFKGTRVSVLGLRDLNDWRRKERINEITASLARLISPFEATSTFPVGIILDGVEHSLVSVTDELLSKAVAEFEFQWGPREDGGPNVLTARARIRKRLLASKRTQKLKQRTELVFDKDGGKGFTEWLPGYSRFKSYPRRSIDLDARWFVEVEDIIEWEEIVPGISGDIADPGPFSGAFYFFHLVGNDDLEEAAAGTQFDKNLIKSMSGISVLRDGFRVRSHGDWLELSSGMTSGSTYNMRPENTVGYFALSGEWNFALTEKSDREGFVENAAYRGFYRIARRCRDFANEALVSVRRAVDEYYKQIHVEDSGRAKSAEESLSELEQNLTSLEQARLQAERALAELQDEIKKLEQGQTPQDSRFEAVTRAMSIASSAASALQKFSGDLAANSKPDALVRRIGQELEDRQDQLAALFESAAVGLSARGLTHELRTHLTEIRKRAAVVEKAVGSHGVSLAFHFRMIRTSCAAIAQAAALIDPMLPRARTVRETFSLREFVEAYFKNRAGAFRRAGISRSVVGHDIIVRTSRSRLLQVLDNLVRNSVFWLYRGERFTGNKAKSVDVELVSDGFILQDSGPGIHPRYEETLFEIFVTGKSEKDGGQGLGLFIVTQLLELDGCTIALLPDRNEYGRRYRFHVDLSAVIQS